MLLHNILELETGVPLDEFFKDSVTRPLGLTDQVMFRPDPREDEIVMTSGSEPPGLVHDLNSRALGGVSGHAGLFGTLRGVVRIAQEILEAIGNRPSIFDHYTALRFSQRASVHGRFMRPMGFDFSSGPASAFGSRPRDGGIGHTGFTGGSLWIDPGYDLIIVILTNRVFMGQDGAMIKEFRQRVHDTLYMELIEKG
jgi:CubicO group peptidase (beta-lactamase class C family)